MKNIKVKNNMNKTIDITDLKPEQIAHLQSIINEFKTKNNIDNNINTQNKLENTNEFDLSDIFFESDIIQPFNRSMLYGKRA